MMTVFTPRITRRLIGFLRASEPIVLVTGLYALK